MSPEARLAKKNLTLVSPGSTALTVLFVVVDSTTVAAVYVGGTKLALARTYRDIVRHRTLQTSAALAYYLVLSIFPGLILLSAILGLLPFPDLFAQALSYMGRILPSEAVGVVYSVLNDVLKSHHGTWLSVGMLGTIWVASTAFDAMIDALNVAYEAPDDRPFWKSRLLAIALAICMGGLLFTALVVMIVGPRFGAWLATHLEVSMGFATAWPILHWALGIGLTVLAVEIIYFFAPRVKQRFLATLPGAILFVGVWVGLSFLLGVYFRHFASYSRTYGALGGLIAFMTWLYWTSFVLLLGAELNCELAKTSTKGSLLPKRDFNVQAESAETSDTGRAA